MSFLAIKLKPESLKGLKEPTQILTGDWCKIDQLSHGLISRARSFSSKISWIQNSEELLWIRPNYGLFDQIFLFVGEGSFPWKKLQKVIGKKEKSVSLAGDFTDKEEKEALSIFSKTENLDLKSYVAFEGLSA